MKWQRCAKPRALHEGLFEGPEAEECFELQSIRGLRQLEALGYGQRPFDFVASDLAYIFNIDANACVAGYG